MGLSAAQPDISGPDQVCQLDHDFYTTSALSGQPVSWTVTNGLILQGQDSTTVEVQWGGAGPAQIWVNECNATDTLDVTISICSRLEDNHEAGFSLYPNPVSGSDATYTFTVEVPAEGPNIWSLRLIDLTGRELRSNTYQGIRAEVKGNQLASRIYIVEIQRGSQISRQRLVIDRD